MLVGCGVPKGCWSVVGRLWRFGQAPVLGATVLLGESFGLAITSKTTTHDATGRPFDAVRQLPRRPLSAIQTSESLSPPRPPPETHRVQLTRNALMRHLAERKKKPLVTCNCSTRDSSQINTSLAGVGTLLRKPPGANTHIPRAL